MSTIAKCPLKTLNKQNNTINEKIIRSGGLPVENLKGYALLVSLYSLLPLVTGN